MRNKIANYFWGLAFIGAGFLLLGNIMEWWDFNLFFNGWWTLFIIIPCLVSMFQYGINTGSVIGLCVGVVLFLSANDIVSSKIMLPVILIGVGISIVLPSLFGKSIPKDVTFNDNGGRYQAIFTNYEMRWPDEVFNGASANIVFGGMELDLRDAIIDHDVIIKCNCAFGGLDIFVPDNVKVQVGGSHIFGGVENKSRQPGGDAPIVYVDINCAFGGADIK